MIYILKTELQAPKGVLTKLNEILNLTKKNQASRRVRNPDLVNVEFFLRRTPLVEILMP